MVIGHKSPGVSDWMTVILVVPDSVKLYKYMLNFKHMTSHWWNIESLGDRGSRLAELGNFTIFAFLNHTTLPKTSFPNK